MRLPSPSRATWWIVTHVLLNVVKKTGEMSCAAYRATIPSTFACLLASNHLQIKLLSQDSTLSFVSTMGRQPQTITVDRCDIVLKERLDNVLTESAIAACPK